MTESLRPRHRSQDQDQYFGLDRPRPTPDGSHDRAETEAETESETETETEMLAPIDRRCLESLSNVEESVRMTGDSEDKWRKYVRGVANPWDRGRPQDRAEQTGMS